ncbi:hypothetical protein ABEO92_01885 [Geobacillus stearothermophilus]
MDLITFHYSEKRWKEKYALAMSDLSAAKLPDAKERQHAAKPHSCAERRLIGDFAEHDRTKRPHAKRQADDEFGRQADMVRKQPVA